MTTCLRLAFTSLERDLGRRKKSLLVRYGGHLWLRIKLVLSPNGQLAIWPTMLADELEGTFLTSRPVPATPASFGGGPAPWWVAVRG